MKQDSITTSVQNYYGKELKGSSDLKTNACMTGTQYPKLIKDILCELSDEVMSKYYGCGLTIPLDFENLQGINILDLGSGSGRDCFIASKLVGPNGSVIGIDMTEEQLKVANDNIDYHRKMFGFANSNIKFLKGQLEKLDELKLPKNSFDLIISNCVINLCLNKEKVLRDAYNLLKDGGEMYFSDVYTNKRVPQELTLDAELYGECLSGALYWNDFLTFARRSGFSDPRVVDASAISIENSDIQNKLQGHEFYSVTYRLFKIPKLESDCEDYGQAVIYKGSLENSPQSYLLDKGHLFERGRVHSVCGNTYLMLKESRLHQHFEFIGNFETHYGIFPGCGTSNPFANLQKNQSSSTAGACC
jgi:arsenite methyltransferase